MGHNPLLMAVWWSYSSRARKSMEHSAAPTEPEPCPTFPGFSAMASCYYEGFKLLESAWDGSTSLHTYVYLAEPSFLYTTLPGPALNPRTPSSSYS